MILQLKCTSTLKSFKFGMTNNEAVQFNRVHHQLSPNEFRFNHGGEGWMKLMDDLKVNRGHQHGSKLTSGIIQSIYVLPDGTIEAVSDHRHDGVPDGN